MTWRRISIPRIVTNLNDPRIELFLHLSDCKLQPIVVYHLFIVEMLTKDWMILSNLACMGVDSGLIRVQDDWGAENNSTYLRDIIGVKILSLLPGFYSE